MIDLRLLEEKLKHLAFELREKGKFFEADSLNFPGRDLRDVDYGYRYAIDEAVSDIEEFIVNEILTKQF